MVAGNTEFIRGAAHAEGIDASQFRGLDLEIAEIRADLRDGHSVPCFDAGRAADYLQDFAAYVHFAHMQFVCLGMLSNFQKTPYDHVVIGHPDMLHTVNGHALGSKDLGQFLRAIGYVDNFFQPFVRYIHDSPLLLVFSGGFFRSRFLRLGFFSLQMGHHKALADAHALKQRSLRRAVVCAASAFDAVPDAQVH